MKSEKLVHGGSLMAELENHLLESIKTVREIIENSTLNGTYGGEFIYNNYHEKIAELYNQIKGLRR